MLSDTIQHLRRVRERGVVMDRRFTAVFERDGDWWVAYAEELPGANSQGRTLDEARANLKEAIVLIVEANRAIAYQNRIPKQEVVKEELVIEV